MIGRPSASCACSTIVQCRRRLPGPSASCQSLAAIGQAASCGIRRLRIAAPPRPERIDSATACSGSGFLERIRCQQNPHTCLLLLCIHTLMQCRGRGLSVALPHVAGGRARPRNSAHISFKSLPRNARSQRSCTPSIMANPACSSLTRCQRLRAHANGCSSAAVGIMQFLAFGEILVCGVVRDRSLRRSTWKTCAPEFGSCVRSPPPILRHMSAIKRALAHVLCRSVTSSVSRIVHFVQRGCAAALPYCRHNAARQPW